MDKLLKGWLQPGATKFDSHNTPLARRMSDTSDLSGSWEDFESGTQMVAIERRRSESHVTAQPASPLAPKPEPVPVTVRTYKEFVEKDPASAAMLLPTQHGTLLIRLGKAIADHENSQKPNRTSQALATIANQVRAKVPLSDTAKTALTYLSTSDDKLGVYKQVLLAALQHQPAPMGDCTPSARPEPI